MQNGVVRIAHMIPGRGIGGVEVATLRIADGLPKERYESIFFCLFDSTETADYFQNSGYRVVEYEKQVLGLRNPFPFWKASREIAASLRRERIGIVHCSDYLAAQYCVAGAAIAGCKIVCHVRNRFEDIPRRDQLLFRLVDQFVFVSRDSWQTFGAKVSPERGRVLYDGFDAGEIDFPATQREVRQRFGILPGQKIVGMSARIAEQKDHETLVRAAPRILAVHPNVRFLLVGDHSSFPTYRTHYARIKALIGELGVEESFIFTGFRTDAVRLTAAMDVFVLSTHAEGLPLVLLEAMLLGRPCVATGIDGIPEVISSGKTGLLVPPRDPAALADCIISLLNDPARAAVLGDSGRLDIQKRFSVDQFRINLNALYQSLVK